MAAAASDEESFEEVDPTGRFGRYATVLGLGSVKKVYRGFDQEEGIEVAWNRVRVRALAERDPAMVDRLHAEVRLLRSLHHDHIIGFHKVWLDHDHGVLNFITEVCNSGSLRDYRERHKRVSVKALKKWARQILDGLEHLHNHDPCIIHRDLNCSNVFINGNTGQNELKKVRIQWGLILQDVLGMFGAPDAVYRHEKSDGMVQVHVHVRVPVDKSRTMFKDVEAHGIKCPELWLAESTAAIAALQEFERTPFHGRIIDVSSLRCEEMETSCNRLLLKTGEVYRGVKLLLSDYEDSMEKAEGCYKSFFEEVFESNLRGTNRVHCDILLDIAHRIYEVNKENYMKFKEMSVESTEIKGAEWDVRSRSEEHFRDRCHDMPKKRGGDSPPKIKICMKIVLDEMISSLGWEKPVYGVTRIGTNLFVCEIILTPKPGYLVSDKKTVTIGGVEGASHSDAVERACQSAILFLDTKMNLRLVDLNYVKRSHAELYLSEASEVTTRAMSMGEKVLAGWENMVDALHACEEYCWSIVMEHPEKEPWNQVYNLKYRCADDVSHLYAGCLSDLMRAKDRHSWLSSWTDQQVYP